MIIKTYLVILCFMADAITIYPFIFIGKWLNDENLALSLKEEQIHYNQQKEWFKKGFGIGLLVYFLLYLFCFPVGYNPFRWKWELEAMLARGLEKEIAEAQLRKNYYLWCM